MQKRQDSVIPMMTSLAHEKNYLAYWLEQLGMRDVASLADRLISYMDLVLERNEFINLTAITDRDEFIKTHILGSLAVYNFRETKQANTIVDLGTGPGFPGVPLALVFPDKRFTLVDSLKKRLDFIQEALDALGLSNISLVHSRAEDFGRSEARESFDLCVSRAVASLPVLLEYCLPLVKVGGTFLAYKALSAKEEIEDAQNVLRLLGAGGSVEIRPAAFYDDRLGHNICVVSKLRRTPKTYPRGAGVVRKVPL